MKFIETTCTLCGPAACEAIHELRDRLYGTTPATFTLVRCRVCGLARLNPRPADLAPHYPQRYWHEASAPEEFYRRLMLRDHVRFALATLPDGGKRALDVGCGSGLFARMLREISGGTVRSFGIDVSAQAAAKAAQQNCVPAAVGNLENAPFSEGSWDLITMFHVLEHVIDPASFLDAAGRLLAPGGRIVVQVPNLDSWQYGWLGARWIGLDAPRHLYNFRFRDLRQLLETRGLRIVRVKHFSWRDNAAALATSLAPWLEPVAHGSQLWRDLLYAGLTATALPFAALESAFRCGASVMVAAERATETAT